MFVFLHYDYLCLHLPFWLYFLFLLLLLSSIFCINIPYLILQELEQIDLSWGEAQNAARDRFDEECSLKPYVPERKDDDHNWLVTGDFLPFQWLWGPVLACRCQELFPFCKKSEIVVMVTMVTVHVVGHGRGSILFMFLTHSPPTGSIVVNCIHRLINMAGCYRYGSIILIATGAIKRLLTRTGGYEYRLLSKTRQSLFMLQQFRPGCQLSSKD